MTVKKVESSQIIGQNPSSYLSFIQYSLSTIMAKGKNHDRKAQPGFGKPKSTSGEFTLKKVKGQLQPGRNFLLRSKLMIQARISTEMPKKPPKSRC